MASCVIFGGSGFVGTHVTRVLLEQKIFSHVYLGDIRTSLLEKMPNVTFFKCDVRQPITLKIDEPVEWIYNFAAIHREPGHKPSEYFETNLKGAEHVCRFAEQVKCKNIFFTSSISVYGPTSTPTDESRFPNPITAYGGSKYPAELIHQVWANGDPDRRLVITRPGVIYGPGDPGNILRMIKAIKKGYFVFPGSSSVYKSYAYIFGFIDSVLFMMRRPEKILIYNYVETPTQTIYEIANVVKKRWNRRSPIISLPTKLLLPAAHLLQIIKRDNNPIHPVRVRKAGTSTHIVPQVLVDLKFHFKYSFEKSLDHWESIAKEDFD